MGAVFRRKIPLCLYEIGKGGGGGIPGGDTGIHLRAPNAAETHRRISERKKEAVSEILHSADGGLYFTVTDPDGNILKVGQDLNL